MDRPVDRIIRHLEEVQGPGHTTAGKLMGWWELEPERRRNRVFVDEDLAAHGIRCEPALADCREPDTRIAVTLIGSAPAAAPPRPAPDPEPPRPSRPAVAPRRDPETPRGRDREPAPPQGQQRPSPSWFSRGPRATPPEPVPDTATAPVARGRRITEPEPADEPGPAREPLRLPKLSELPLPTLPKPRELLEAGRIEPLLLGLGSVVVVLGLSLPWFRATSDGEVVQGLRTGWDWLALLDFSLLTVALAAVALAVLRKVPETVIGARVVAGAALLSLLAVAWQMVSPPGGLREGFLVETSSEIGPLVTAVGICALMTGAGMLAGFAQAPAPAAQVGTPEPERQPS